MFTSSAIKKQIQQAIKAGDYRVVRGDEAEMPCPACGEEKVFSVNLTTGNFSCFRASCHITGNINTESSTRRCIWLDPNAIGSPRTANVSTSSVLTLPSAKTLYNASNAFWEAYALKYVKSRGVSDTQIKKYNVSLINEGLPRIIFPIYGYDGNIYNYSTRALLGTDFPKSTKPKIEDGQVPIEARIWNGSSLKKGIRKVYISEGVWDALAIERVANDGVSVALLTSSISDDIICWFLGLGIEECIIALDPDAISCAESIAKRMNRVGLRCRVAYTTADPDEMSESDLASILKMAKLPRLYS